MCFAISDFRPRELLLIMKSLRHAQCFTCLCIQNRYIQGTPECAEELWDSMSQRFGRGTGPMEGCVCQNVYRSSASPKMGAGPGSRSLEEGLECPVCWESFDDRDNTPYVLWCGHSLCKNCVLIWSGLQ